MDAPAVRGLERDRWKVRSPAGLTSRCVQQHRKFCPRCTRARRQPHSVVKQGTPAINLLDERKVFQTIRVGVSSCEQELHPGAVCHRAECHFSIRHCHQNCPPGWWSGRRAGCFARLDRMCRRVEGSAASELLSGESVVVDSHPIGSTMIDAAGLMATAAATSRDWIATSCLRGLFFQRFPEGFFAALPAREGS